MPVTKITVPAITGSTIVTIARPCTDALASEAVGHRAVRAALGCWGVNSSGDAYFDAHGAVEAERATMTIDQFDNVVLVPERVQDGERVRMRRGAGRAYLPGSHVRYAMPETPR